MSPMHFALYYSVMFCLCSGMRQAVPNRSPAHAARVAQAETVLRQYINSLNFTSKNGGNQPYKPATERLQEQRADDLHNHMVARLDSVFHALADATRRAMLTDLGGGERSIAELAKPHAMSRTGAAKHVDVLMRAGLVERRTSGREQRCRLRAEAMAEAGVWLSQWAGTSGTTIYHRSARDELHP